MGGTGNRKEQELASAVYGDESGRNVCNGLQWQENSTGKPSLVTEPQGSCAESRTHGTGGMKGRQEPTLILMREIRGFSSASSTPSRVSHPGGGACV